MIEQIWIAREERIDTQRVTDIQVVAGSGIVGDRNFDKSKWLGQNITFIESETIVRFNKEFDQNIAFGATRRNVITKGIDLNSLVDKEFSIGGARFRGVELCEPCKYFGGLLENETVASEQVVKAFVHHGGLRADVIHSGNLSTGMSFDLNPSTMREQEDD